MNKTEIMKGIIPWEKDTKPHIRDCVDAMKGLNLWLNILTNKEMIGNEPVTGQTIQEIKTFINGATTRMIEIGVDVLCGENEKNPMIEMFMEFSEKNDPERDYISEVASHFHTDCPYLSEILTVYLCNAVKKVLVQGNQNFALCLRCDNKIGASTFAEWLGNDYFSDRKPPYQGREYNAYCITMAENLITEIPEDGLRKNKISYIKHEIEKHSKNTVLRRGHRNYEYVPVRTSWIATCGKDFSESLDNWRFVTVDVDKIDDDLNSDSRMLWGIDSRCLWGQAYSLVKDLNVPTTIGEIIHVFPTEDETAILLSEEASEWVMDKRNDFKYLAEMSI